MNRDNAMQGKGMWRAAVAFVLALTISACGGVAVKQPQPQQRAGEPKPAVGRLGLPSGPLRVAVLVPLTGDFAPIGQQLVNAAAIALFEDQQTPFELVPFDTRGTPAGAAAAAAAAAQEQADLVIGPLFGRHVAHAPQALAGSQAAMLTFTNDTALAGGKVFVLGVSVESQIERLALALAQAEKRRLLLLGPEGEYTARALASVQALAATGQLALVRSATFAPDADFNSIAEQVRLLTDYDRRRGAWRAYEGRIVQQVRQSQNPPALLRSEAARFPEDSIRQRMLTGMAAIYDQHISRGRNQALAEVISRIEGVDAMPADDFDAVLLPFGNESLVAVGSMLDLYNAGLPFAQVAGTSVWQQAELSREPSFHGAWYTGLDRVALEPFLLAYRSQYLEEPDPIAVLGYYAARVAAAAADRQTRPVTPAFVQAPQGFQGLGGPVRFGSDNRMQAPLEVFEVTPDGPSPVLPPEAVAAQPTS